MKDFEVEEFVGHGIDVVLKLKQGSVLRVDTLIEYCPKHKPPIRWLASLGKAGLEFTLFAKEIVSIERMPSMRPTYDSIMKRRKKAIEEIKQFKVDAESWNDNHRPPGEPPIDTKWCDEMLQKMLELIPRKPR